MAEALRKALRAAREPDLIVTVGDVPVTWAAFTARVAGWAALLNGLPGRRWGLYCEDTLEAAVRLWGAWAAGKTVVLPGDGLPATVASLAPHVSGWLAGGGDPLNEPAPQGAACPLIPDDLPALEVYTSGSTGQAVAIPKSLRQLDAEIQEIEACWGATVGDSVLVGTVPHQHLYGLLFRLLWPIASGRCFLARQLRFPEEVAVQLAARPCALVSSPAFLKRWPAALDLNPAKTPPCVVFSSGGPLPHATSTALQARLACPVVEIYGSSETGGVAWRVQGEPDTPWQPHRGLSLVIDETVFRLRSPFLPDPDVWVVLDDRAQTTSNGFHLLGRADRIVKIEEKRVSLDAMDAALTALPDIDEARTCPLPDGRLGAVLVLSALGRTALEAEGRTAFFHRIKQTLTERFEAVTLPRRWRTVPALPVTPMGKTPLAALQDLFVPKGVLPDMHCLAQTADHAEFTLAVSPTLAAFNGHFPDVPILPGVVQVDWAMHYAQACFALPGTFMRIEALKFHHAVHPDDILHLALDRVSGKSAVNFAFSRNAQTIASGRLIFGSAA